MQDLIEVLREIEEVDFPIDAGAVINEDGAAEKGLPVLAVLLDRVEVLANEYLTFQRGRLEGQPDYYNFEQLKSEGYSVTDRGCDEYGMFKGGVIHTTKGKIAFGV